MAYQASVLPSWYERESVAMQKKHNPGQNLKSHKTLVGSIEFANKVQQQTMGGFCGRAFEDLEVPPEERLEADRQPGSLAERLLREFNTREAERRSNREKPSKVSLGAAVRKPDRASSSAAEEAAARAAGEQATALMQTLKSERADAYARNRVRAMQATMRIGAPRSNPRRAPPVLTEPPPVEGLMKGLMRA